jgi:hypothetical protein
LPTPTASDNPEKNTGKMKQDGLQKRARIGLLPTPTAMDSTNATVNMKSPQLTEGSMHSVTLTRAMAMGLLPTPAAYDWNSTESPEKYLIRKEKMLKERNINLHLPLKQWARMLPTPNQRDYLGCTTPGTRITSTVKTQNYGEVLPDTIKRITGTTSQLNPLFVEEMMGFPKNWTTLPFLNGETKV